MSYFPQPEDFSAPLTYTSEREVDGLPLFTLTHTSNIKEMEALLDAVRADRFHIMLTGASVIEHSYLSVKSFNGNAPFAVEVELEREGENIYLLKCLTIHMSGGAQTHLVPNSYHEPDSLWNILKTGRF